MCPPCELASTSWCWPCRRSSRTKGRANGSRDRMGRSAWCATSSCSMPLVPDLRTMRRSGAWPSLVSSSKSPSLLTGLVANALLARGSLNSGPGSIFLLHPTFAAYPLLMAGQQNTGQGGDPAGDRQQIDCAPNCLAVMMLGPVRERTFLGHAGGLLAAAPDQPIGTAWRGLLRCLCMG